MTHVIIYFGTTTKAFGVPVGIVKGDPATLVMVVGVTVNTYSFWVLKAKR